MYGEELMLKQMNIVLWGIVFIALTLSSCLPEYGTATPITASTASPELASETEASPTPQPPPLRELNICLGQEPTTLYPYGDLNPAAKSVLAAIYDGPYDNLSYEYLPAILQKMPSIADGDVVFMPIEVMAGDEVVDINGEIVTLAKGVQVYNAGCQGADCVITYDGAEKIFLDAMVVTFSLLPELRWSDGNPITADDSVYAYDLAILSEVDSLEYILERTEAYEAIDPLSIAWHGKAGYRDNSYMTNFFAPMPYHAWSEFSPRDLLDTDISSRFPVGWGAYVVNEWLPRDMIRLVANPIYFRADEGLPKLDVINFYFYANPEEALAAMLTGECDLLDPSIPLDGHLSLLKEIGNVDKAQLHTTESTSIEQLAFGIQPASHDDGIVSGHDRLDFFADPKMRQAIATCLDREQVAENVLHGFSTVPESYTLPEHSLNADDLPFYDFDIDTGAEMLAELGWKDVDDDPATPRVAYKVDNIPDGSQLILRYMTTTSIQRRQSSEILAQSLRDCGIGIDLSYLSVDEFYAPAPDGVLLGRNFDLAQFAIGTDSPFPPCAWYTTAEIPNAANNWIGANLSGYSNAAFDIACRDAQQSLPDDLSFRENYQLTQSIFAEELPSVPLFAHLRVAVARPDMCGFSLDPSSDSALWNIENFDYGSCSQ